MTESLKEKLAEWHCNRQTKKVIDAGGASWWWHELQPEMQESYRSWATEVLGIVRQYEAFSTPDRRPIFGEGSAHDIGEHLERICSIPDVEISNTLHRLNLDRPDLAALPEGSTIACNITTLRQAADLIKRLDQARSAIAAMQAGDNNPGITGNGEPCYDCGEPCDSFAGNPGRWPIILCHKNEPGAPKSHHSACVAKRLEAPDEQPATLTEEQRAEAVEIMCEARFPLSWKAVPCDVERQYMARVLSALLDHYELRRRA